MGWNAQDIEKLRNGQNKRTAAHTAATAQTAAPHSAAQTVSNARGWTADDIAALRSGTGTKKTTEAWENRSTGAGTRLSGTGSLSGQVLAQMMGSTGSTNPKLQLAVPQTKQSTQAYPGKNGIVTGQSAAQTTPLRGGTAQPEWLTKAQPENRTAEKASAPAARATGTVKPTEQQRIAGIARGEEGRYAQTAQKVKQYTEDLKATDDFSDFDRLNQWMDADPRHRKLVSLMRAGMGGQSYAERNNAMQPRSVSGAAASTAVPEKSAGGRGYTDSELLEKGYSRKEISEARQYIEDFDALPGWQRAARRTANTIRGIGDTVASSVFLAGETGVQSVKNAAATSGNWKQLQQSVQDDDRKRTLLNLMTGGKTRYAEQDHSMPLAGSSQSGSDSNAYTDAELMAKGYTRQEIDNMRARIAGTEVKDSVDPEKSLGYQLYKRGQDLTAAAQAGLSPIEKQALGIVSSAGENLAVAGINPALVLPVLSAQGGAEAMGQSIEKGESAGKTLAGGLAKFGAGWAINSVGAADLARTMGSDYAKDTLAGKLADVVRSVAADGRLAQQYPAIANTISGGVDNAMQAFVETYADKAIDAALGDSEAAESMFTAETFLNAVESGLTGGASGALGGAVGTGLGKMSAALNAAAGGHTAAAEDAAQKAVRDELRAQEPGSELLQPPAGGSSLKEEAMGTEREVAGNNKTGLFDNEKAGADNAVGVQNTTPIVRSENPAVQQLASAMEDGSLTGKTINLFTPNAENEAKRAAFAEEYGAQLPETVAKTGQVLREMAAQQQPTQSMTTASEDAAIAEQEQVAKEDTQTAFTEREALNKAQTDAGDGTVQQVQTESPEVEQTVVENTGESVESRKAEQPGGMRETYGLTQQSLNAKQREVQQELTRWKISDGASETISRNMPAEIGDAERYAAAASSLYRLGQMEDVTTFDKAMELAQGMRGLAVNTDYVLAQDGGRQALNLAWLQGHGELEAGKAQLGSLGGSLTKESISGSGRVLYKGTMRTVNEVGTQLIELNAKATSTDAVMKAVLQGNDRVKAYVDTETGRIFFSDRAEDVFGTILHEDYHWYNSLDAEGAQALQQHALEYLAKSEGFEGIDEMIREKLSDYEQQELTYEEAAEELVADAWRGIFSDEASFKRWVEFQRGQAEKNAGKAGTIRKVMTKVKEMLTDIISRAKEVLAKDPENKAALKAQRLAEAEKRALQDEYFAHAEKAMDNLRAAKENAAALENKGAAKEKRYEINPEYADDVDQWDKDGRNSNRTFILGRTGDALQSLGARENDIYMKADKINTILKEHPEMTLEEIKRIPEILDDPVMILTSQNKGRTKQNTRLVMFGDVKAQDGRPVLCVLDLRPVENHIVISDMQKVTSAYTKDVNPVEFVRKSDVLYVDEKKERTTELFRTLGFKIPSELQLSGSIGRITYGNQDVKLSGVKFTELVNIAKTKIEPSGGTHVESEDSRSRLPDGSKESIAQEAAENKENDGTLKKNIRYQLSEADELTKLRDEQQRLDEQRRELKEERSAWLGSNAVKEIEAKKKALGSFSAEAKAYRDSEEYQNYLAKRKDYNARMAQLEDQSAVLNGRIKEAGARMQQQNAEKGKAEQAVYDAKAEAHGGKAEYRRVLAKERFGTTEDFRRAGYILPDGQMLDFAQNDRTRDTDHREIMSVFGSAEVKNGTEALNEFLLDGNVRVMAEAPGVDLSADTAPTTQQLEQIWRMVQELGGEKRQFTLDISTADGRVAAGKEYSGRVDADRVVREIREYYQTGELAQESDLAKFRYQLAEQADRDAKRNDQQTASRTIADKAAALDTLSQFFGLTRGVKVSRTAIEGLASRWAKANGSKVDRAKLARETEVLVEYLKADGADMNKAEALAETLAGEVLDGTTYRNSELWDEYPELHKLEYTVNKTGQAKAELVKAYGSWSEAVAEARKHGVCLRQADGVQDGNPAEQYESVINDYRAVGGISDGAKALWKAAAQQAGVDGAGSMESTEWLSVLMNLHDAIKPATMSRFADDAEYEDAKVELAGRMIGDILNTPEMTDAQAIFEGIQQHSLQMAKAAAGSEERAAEVEKGLKGVQKVQQREFGRRLAENRRAANRSTELQQMTELQRQNAKAEKLLDENLETLGVDITNMGDLNEKLTFLRESYEREMKQEVKRMKAERQEMLDEAKLEMQKLRSEKNELAWQLKQEQRRADKAEYSLIVQENEIVEWEADNERKRAAFEQKQAQRNAIAIETARQQRDEDIAAAKAMAEKRVQRARDARKMDELKRGIRQNAAQLNQMLLRPSKDKHVPQSLISAAADVAKMADAVILNDRAVNRLTALQDSIEHLMTGGFVIPNAKYYSKGDIEQAYQKGQAVHLGMLKNADGTPTADSILQTVEAAMTDYDRAWCRIMKEFFGSYTAKLINETSLQLVGYQRATEKNYYPIAVDKSALATQIEGLNLDATIEGRGFLKNRVKSSQPILLEECSNVVQRSLRDTAAYAGLAAPIRDVQKILNSGVETEDGLTNLKNGLIKQQWGKDAVSYIDDLLTDLQTTQRKRPSTFNKVLGNLRGNYAGAVLTLNPGVAIAQAASLPTAAAVLGGDTMAAVVPFVKNASPKQRAALEAEIKEHGDVLLDLRKRGSQNGELASIGKQKTLAEKGMDKLPNWLTGWINGMDEVTVAALWEGSKRYVQNHTAEFEGAEVTGSPAYWEAVNRTYQKVIEQTQPNYTVMQRAGIQRNPNELLKQLTMFTTQRFQNYGILADAVGDYKAQAERYQQNQSAENKAEKQRAGKQLRRAAVSQVAQTAVFAVMKIGADFLLHRWDREQDENGDVTVKSMWNRFRSLFTESFAGNFLYGSEIYSLIDNAMNGKDYDVLSAASISVVNDLAGDAQKFFAEFRKDTSDMDEEKLQQHHEKLIKRFMNLLEDSFEVAGVPYGNGRKIVEAVHGYVNDIENITHGRKFSFNSVPQSATGQYDRLYNAYRNKDVDEARAATEKLAEMGKDGEIYKQLKTRLKKYDPNIQKAAEAQVNGDEVQRYQLETKTIEQIYEVMGIRKNVKEDAQKREAVIDCVTGAVNAMADEQLKGDGGSVTDDLVEALDSGRAQDVQQELNRLMTAGKDAKNLKSKITEVCKPEYLAGSGTDKQQMKEMLLGLTDAEGNALYTEKTFDTWTRNAEKAAEKEDVTADPYAALK